MTKMIYKTAASGEQKKNIYSFWVKLESQYTQGDAVYFQTFSAIPKNFKMFTIFSKFISKK